MDTLRVFIFFFISVSAQTSYGQDLEEMLWSSERRLTWEDFRGEVPRGSGAAATTASGITYQFSSIETQGGMEVDFVVSAFFYPEKSWYKPSICNELVLSHEQLHFDISELYARKMRDVLRKTRFTKNVKAEIRAIYKRILKELDFFQNRYDKETNFSRDREKQLIWNSKIQEALK